MTDIGSYLIIGIIVSGLVQVLKRLFNTSGGYTQLIVALISLLAGGVYLVFKDTGYIATVELQCFSLKCEILDSEHKLDTDELCEINLAVLKKIQEEFNANNPTTDKMVPPPPDNLFTI